MDIPHLAVAATGSVDATDTKQPHPIHHRPSGYQIDSNKLEKFQRPLRAKQKNQQAFFQ